MTAEAKKPAINTPPSNSDDWANDVQSALGLEAGQTNTTAHLSNPITNASKQESEKQGAQAAEATQPTSNGQNTQNTLPGTPDVDTSMPGGFAGGIASAGTGVSLKDASLQARDAAAKAYEAAAGKVNAYTDSANQQANEKGPNDLLEVAGKVRQDDHDPSIPVKDLANDTQPGMLSEYSDKAKAAAAGLAGTGVALGAAGVVATKETEAAAKTEADAPWKPKAHAADVLPDPMDFPKGAFPELEKLKTNSALVPQIPGATKERVENSFNEKKEEEKKQQDSNKATEAVKGVTAAAGGAGAASAVVANKHAPHAAQKNIDESKSDKTNTIATDRTGHNVSPPSSSADLVKNSKDSRVTPKRSFSQRIKGDMKILFGKLSKNDSKVSQGREMKGN